LYVLVTSHDHFNQPIMFHKRQNSISRYFASEGKIANKDILPQEAKLEEPANCLAGHGWAGLKKNKCEMPSVYGRLWAGCCGLCGVRAWKILDGAIPNTYLFLERCRKSPKLREPAVV